MGRPPFGGHRSVGAALDGVRDRAPEAPRPRRRLHGGARSRLHGGAPPASARCSPPARLLVALCARPARIRPALSAHRVPGRDVNSPRPHPPGALSTVPAAMQCVNVTHVSVHPYSIRSVARLVRRRPSPWCWKSGSQWGGTGTCGLPGRRVRPGDVHRPRERRGGGRPGLLRAGDGHDGVRLRPNGRSRPCRVPSRADGRRGPRGSESADERRRERRRRRARPGAVVVRRPLRRIGGLAVSAEAEVGARGKRTRERRIRR